MTSSGTPGSGRSTGGSAAANSLAALAFAAELALLVSLAVAGAGLGPGTGLHVVLAVALPVAAAVVWSRWFAPRSPHRLRDPGRLLAQVTLFVVAGVLLAAVGHPLWAGVVTVASIVAFGATRLFPGAAPT